MKQITDLLQNKLLYSFLLLNLVLGSIHAQQSEGPEYKITQVYKHVRAKKILKLADDARRIGDVYSAIDLYEMFIAKR